MLKRKITVERAMGADRELPCENPCGKQVRFAVIETSKNVRVCLLFCLGCARLHLGHEVVMSKLRKNGPLMIFTKGCERLQAYVETARPLSPFE